MYKNAVTLFVLFFAVVQLNAQSYSIVALDKNITAQVGSQNLLTLHRIIYTSSAKYIPDTLFHEKTFWRKLGGMAYRGSKMVLLEQPIDQFLKLTNHEVFGHGGRFREMEYKDISYNMKLDFPYGVGGGFSAAWSTSITASVHERIAISIGGIEANKILADNITIQALLNDKLHYRQAMLYYYSQNNLFYYLLHTSQGKGPGRGNDMIGFMNMVNSYYSFKSNERYTINQLSNQSFVAFANPMQFYAIYALYVKYLFQGKPTMEIPMIKMGRVKYLPALNFSLSPFGSQYHLVNYLRYQKQLFVADVHLGDNTFNTFYGMGIKGFNIINRKIVTVNAHYDVWNQPELELETRSSIVKPNQWGQAFKIDCIVKPFKRYEGTGLFFQVGYKTKGFMAGEQLSASPIMRAGLAFAY